MTLRGTICLLLLASVTRAAEWSYEEPDKWKDDHPTCGGSSQSPIDIQLDKAVYSQDLDAFSLDGYDQTADRTFKMFNNGHTVQVDVEGSYVLSGGDLDGDYKLAQFHFHWGTEKNRGSEHTIDGDAYPLEVHFVHYSDKYDGIGSSLEDPKGLAVLGFFFETTDTQNTVFQTIVDKLPDINNNEKEVTIPTFSLTSLMANRDKYYRYQGSLTTPACFEVVVWTVFNETIKINQAQMDAFRELYANKEGEEEVSLVNNFRPVQDLNDRQVFSSYTVDTDGAATAVVTSLLLVLSSALAILL